MALVVNASELLSEIQFRQQYAAGEVERRHVRLDALPGDSPERAKLHAEMSVYTAISAELGSLVELATSNTADTKKKRINELNARARARQFPQRLH